MKKIILSIALGFLLLGCGGGGDTAVINHVPVPDINVTNEIPVIDVNVTNEIPVPDVNITVINEIIIDPADYPYLGSGTDADPYLLRQATYVGLNAGETWFRSGHFASAPEGEISGAIFANQYYINAYNEDFIEIPVETTWPRFNFNVNATHWVWMKIRVFEDNVTVSVKGDLLDKPIFFEEF